MGGTQLGRYQVGPCLARGGMAQIHLAIARGPEGFAKPVVVKRLHPHLAERPELVALFLEEARLAAQLRHPNIVQVYELGRDGEDYFLCMEYLPGGDLSSLQAKSRAAGLPVPPAVVAWIGRCVADGLHFAHNFRALDGRLRRVVHGDVSPSNVVVTSLGEVKLIDFGIARTADAPTPAALEAVAGKPSYLAPEQLSGRLVDGRADVFSLGIVLHELLTGERLFRRETEEDTVHALLHDPVPDLRELRPDVPATLTRTVMRALERDPDRRFRSAEALRTALDCAFSDCAPPVPGRALCAAFVGDMLGDQPARTAALQQEATGTATAAAVDGADIDPAEFVPRESNVIPLRPIAFSGTRHELGLVRVAAEVPAALVRAGSSLVAVPAHVASFALEWTRGRLVRWTAIVSLAAFLAGLAVRELHDAARGTKTVLQSLTTPAEAAPPPPPAATQTPAQPPAELASKKKFEKDSRVVLAQVRKNRGGKNRR